MMARVSMQEALAKAIGASMRGVVSASILGVSLSLLFAQQGKSGGLGSVTRLTNGSSYSVSMVQVNDATFAVFVSDATNLIPGASPRTVYLQNLQTGELTPLPNPQGRHAIKTKATCTAAGPARWSVAAQFSNDAGEEELGMFTSGSRQWTLYGMSDGILDFEITNREEVFVLTGSEQSTSGTLLRLTRSSSEVVATFDYAAPSRASLSVSEDGRYVVVSYMANTAAGAAPRLFVRAEYPVDETNWSVVQKILPGTVTERSVSWIADANNGTVVDPTGQIYRIDVLRGTAGTETDIRLTPIDSYPLLASGRVCDMNGGQVVYVSEQGQLRSLDLPTQQDIPIARLSSGDMPFPSRIIKSGKIIFATTEAVIPQDTNRLSDVFIYDVVRLQLYGVTVGPQPRRGLSQNLAIGADASLVAFTSDSSDLVPGKTTSHHDVFVSVNNRLVRLMGVGGAEPDGSSFDVSVSRSGQQKVAFASYASNLVQNDTNNAADVFVWDPQNSYTCLSALLIGGDSYAPAVAPDGVYFLSTATNLIPSNVGVPQAYKWISRSSVQVIRNYNGSYYDSVESIVVSPNGQWVVLTAHHSEGVPAGVYVHDNTLQYVREFTIGMDLYATSVSDDGKIVLSTRARMAAEDNDDNLDVYLWDMNTNSLHLVSRNPVGSKGNGDSFGGTIDAAGRKVAFVSQATNLVPVDLNGEEDVFVYDLVQNTLYCVTRDTMGLPLGGSQARLAANGGAVAFATGRPELVWMPYANGVFIALHQLGCVPNGDVNLDGIVDDADLLAALFAFGQDTASLADLNVDGVVDDADLLIILFNYGTGCQFGAAGGDGDNNEGVTPSPRLEQLASGKAILYYSEPPRYVHFWDEALQRADIDQAVAGRWPYPVAGGLYNAWKHEFGDPSGWSDAEVQAFRQFVDGAGYGGDFMPAWGNPFSWNWTNTYAYQPSSNTYIRFHPKLTFSANACQQFLKGEAEGVLDLQVFGYGGSGIAKFYGQAGMTPGWLGFKAEAWVMGSKIWEDGWYTQQTSWSWSRTYGPVSRNFFNASYNFNILGVPCVAYINVAGYAQATLDFAVTLSPSTATATFTPAAGLNATFAGGVGGTISGITVLAGLQLNFAPFLQLSLPATANVRTENRSGGGCDLVASANVSLTLKALAGNLRAGIFTSCLGSVICKKCSEGERRDIAGFIPAYCCSDSCGGRRKKRRVDASFQVASWGGLNYNLATILNQTWRWPIK